MGDACGLGISSALLMATGRALVRQRSAMPGTLADIVTDVNVKLVRDVEESCQFMALFYLAFDLHQRTLRWVRAGHNPAVFFDPSTGMAEQLRGVGMALGIDEQVPAVSQGEFDSRSGHRTGHRRFVGDPEPQRENVWQRPDFQNFKSICRPRCQWYPYGMSVCSRWIQRRQAGRR